MHLQPPTGAPTTVLHVYYARSTTLWIRIQAPAIVTFSLTSLECPANCDFCKYSSASSGAICEVCNERFIVNSGACVPCSSNEVWDSKTFQCYPGTDMVPQSTFVYNGLTTPGNPFSNKTYLIIEAKYTVDSVNTYEKEEEVRVSINGGFRANFWNITSPIYNYQGNSYTFFITMPEAGKFEKLEFEFLWEGSDPETIVTIDYVKAHALLRDYEQDCLLETSSGSCLECNKYKIMRRSASGDCIENPEKIYISKKDFSGVLNIYEDCSNDDSVKYCWDKDGGAVECYEDNWILIDGYCPHCDVSCDGCRGDPGLNTTDHLFNCLRCPVGNTGLKYIPSNDTNLCVPCKSPACLSCPNDWAVCENCDSGYDLIDGECWVICPPGEWRIDKDTCGDCPLTYQKIDGECWITCGQDNQWRKDKDTCESCHENCLGCDGPGLSSCQQCSASIRPSVKNCSDSSNGFCCYKCPEECSECSWDNRCSGCKDPAYELNQDFQCKRPGTYGEIRITDGYFMKSKGEIVIVFDKRFSIETLDGKYKFETEKGTEFSNCTRSNKLLTECRLRIQEINQQVRNEVFTFEILQGSIVANKETKEEFKVIGKKVIEIKKINFYEDDSASGFKTIGTIFYIIFMVALSFLMLSERTSFLQFFKLTQYIEFILFFNIDFPSNLYNLLSFFNIGLIERIPNPLEGIHGTICRTPQKFIENEAHCYYFDNLGVYYMIFIPMIFFKILLILLTKIFNICQKNSDGKSYLKTLNGHYNNSVLFFVMDMIFFDLVVFSSLQMTRLNYDSAYLTLNCIFGFASITVCLGFVFVTFLYSRGLVDRRLKMFKKSEKWSFNWIQKLSMTFFFDEINMKNFVGRYYILITQLKNLLSGLTIVFLYNSGMAQVTFDLVINIAFFLLIIKQKPFKTNAFYTRDLIITSLIICILCVCLFLTDELRSSDEQYNYSTIGITGIAFVSTLFLLTALYSLYEGISSFIDMVRKLQGKVGERRKKKKRKITPSNNLYPIRPGMDLTLNRRSKKKSKRKSKKKSKKKSKRKSKNMNVEKNNSDKGKEYAKKEKKVDKTKIEKRFNLDRILRMREALKSSRKIAKIRQLNPLRPSSKSSKIETVQEGNK